jgi:hypothetical protein
LPPLALFAHTAAAAAVRSGKKFECVPLEQTQMAGDVAFNGGPLSAELGVQSGS